MAGKSQPMVFRLFDMSENVGGNFKAKYKDCPA